MFTMICKMFSKMLHIDWCCPKKENCCCNNGVTFVEKAKKKEFGQENKYLEYFFFVS